MFSFLEQHPYACLLAASALLPILYRWAKPVPSISGTKVFITGGSEGIGYSLAAECLRRGASVVLFARTRSKLDAAAESLQKHICQDSGSSSEGAGRQFVGVQEMDVCSTESVQKAVKAAVQAFGSPDIVIPCAGKSYPGYFLNTDTSVFSSTMELNYMGTVRVLKEVVPLMLAKEGHRRIMLVSSAAGLVSYIGWGSYSPSKFALRGLGDALRNELHGFGIQVCINYPPDTDTPGFEEEQRQKPEETKACFPADPFPPDRVAATSIDGMLRGDYHIQSPDFLQNLLVFYKSGVTPTGAFLVLQAVLMPIMTMIAQPFWLWFDFQARRYARKVSQERGRHHHAD